ncbi:MAG: DUF4386 family protein [Anaerolineaceae bacterium]|nr:DUF4386 family protein [Anaerolineaceae bacterium]
MNAQVKAMPLQGIETQTPETPWKPFYKVGGMAALGTVLVGLVEIGITFLPGGNTPYKTVYDWLMLFQNNPFMGLRNLGLLNILFCALDVPIFFALYGAHRKTSQTLAGLAMIVSFIGVAVFYATNRAFAMLDISNQYILAATEAQRSILAAAGQAMLAVGQSHTPGTFIAFFLSEVASLLISVVMLQARLFSKANAYVGFLGFSCMLIFEICTSFVPALQGTAMILAMLGGILSLVWEVLVGRRLFQLSRTN